MTPASDGGAYLGTPNPAKNRQNQKRIKDVVGNPHLPPNPNSLARDREDARAESYAERQAREYYQRQDLVELYGPQDDGPQPTRRR